ncbi:MAG TPA: DnaA/Hda family protein [Tepidisphaeraceae bacterium]|nr:DnaA/Hda family protein [Tepidisphaeraceae bacterium]
MRNQKTIKDLQAILSAAVAGWERRYGPEPSRCKQCGGTKYDSFKDHLLGQPLYYRPETFRPELQYCAGCFADLPAKAQELGEHLSRQRLRDERADHLRRYRQHLRGYGMRIGWRFNACRFRNYVPQNTTQATALEKVAKWAGDAAVRVRCPFVVLYGGPGLGKTHLLTAAWQRIARRVRREFVAPIFVNEGRFVADWHNAHASYDRRGGDVEQSPDDLIRDLQTANVVIWDDLGKAKSTDAWDRALYAVVDHRYANGLPTIFSTNFGPGELLKRVQPWTADRVLDGARFSVEGASMRGAA